MKRIAIVIGLFAWLAAFILDGGRSRARYCCEWSIERAEKDYLEVSGSHSAGVARRDQAQARPGHKGHPRDGDHSRHLPDGRRELGPRLHLVLQPREERPSPKKSRPIAVTKLRYRVIPDFQKLADRLRDNPMAYRYIQYRLAILYVHLAREDAAKRATRPSMP